MQEESHDPKRETALLRLLKACATLPPQAVFYGSALAALAAAALSPDTLQRLPEAWASLSPALQAVASGVAVNSLSALLQQLAQGKDVPDDDVRAQVLAAVAESRIGDPLTREAFERDATELIVKQRLILTAVEASEFRLALQLTTFCERHSAVGSDVQAALKAQLQMLASVEQKIDRQGAQFEAQLAEIRAALAKVSASADRKAAPPRAEQRLTMREQEILDFIRWYRQERGYPPTVRTIGAAVGLKAKRVYYYLGRLEAGGYLVRSRDVSRRAHSRKPRSGKRQKRQIPPDGARRRLRVFLCYASEDGRAVRGLYGRLREAEVDPWLDKVNLLPGQDWKREIAKAVRAADAVVVCLSAHSVDKVGYVQKEIRHALDVADEHPEGAIFLIPLRLEECELPGRLTQWQWVDYFSAGGYRRLLEALAARAASLENVVPPLPAGEASPGAPD